jgi:hypothetical protein
MGEHSKEPMPGQSLRACRRCGVEKEFGNEFEECETCDPDGLSAGPDEVDWPLLSDRLHGPDPRQLAKDRTDLIAALIREHDANHPNPAGPTCGCSTCQLLTRLGDPGDGRR